MADYTKPTGATGLMMIRDTGTVVEFWLRAGSGTYNYQLQWYYEVNGFGSWNSFRFVQGGHWQHLGSWNVTTTQTVLFRLGVSGTVGLGGETWFYQGIQRSTIPAAPSPVTLSNIGPTSMHATFSDGANNGASIDLRQIGFGTDPNTPHVFVGSDGSTDITNLSPGTTYYFWAQTRNSNGWGPWGGRNSATTLRVPDTSVVPNATAVSQTSIAVSWTPPGNGGSSIIEYQVGYSTTSAGPSGYSNTSSTSLTLLSLSPGTLYYVWLRARNAVGWSSWSNPRTLRTIAGARIKVGAVWQEAVPYVRVGGVWRLAQPWSRIMGVWRKTM